MERGQTKAEINHILNHQNTNSILNICTGLDFLISTGILSLRGGTLPFQKLSVHYNLCVLPFA